MLVDYGAGVEVYSTSELTCNISVAASIDGDSID